MTDKAKKIREFLTFVGWPNISAAALVLSSPIFYMCVSTDLGRGAAVFLQIISLVFLAGEAFGYARGERNWRPLAQQAQKNSVEMNDLFDKQTQAALKWKEVAIKLGYSDQPSDRNTYFEDN